MMSAVESFLTKPENAKFVEAWRGFWAQMRVYCECQWKYLREVQKQTTLWEVNIEVPLSVTHWQKTYKEWYGKEMPVIAGAAAIFRRDFVRCVAFAMPGEGVEAPDVDDKIEKAMGKCADWESVMLVALNDITKAKEVVARARPTWAVTSETDPITILDLLEKEFKTRLRQLEKLVKPKPTRIALHPLSRSGFILAPADRINKATIEAFTYGAMKCLSSDFLEPFGPGTTFWRAHAFGNEGRSAKKNYIVGAIGFREEPAKHIQRLLQKNGALAVKAQYALWARAYAETNAAPGVYITLTISKFCDDLGMTRKKGAHTLESKRAAIQVLEFLTSMELVCVYKPPKGPVQRIRGPIWSRGIISEELRGYEDVFEGEAVSAKPLWVPKAFSYAPGPFFENEAWRAYNHYIALVGEGLLKLSSMNADKYALMVGGYLAILARMNGYRKCRVKAQTLLEKTGLWAVDRKKNPGRMRKKLEDALDRLSEVGVIKSWDITSSKEDINHDNLDDPHTLESMAEPTRWLDTWLRQTVVVVDWPPFLKQREVALREKKERHIKEASRRRKKTASKTA